MTVERRDRIRMLNDQLRRLHVGGRIFLTQGVVATGPDRVVSTLKAISQFDQFDDRNDPYGEHDFGAVTVEAARVFWKIDYYDQSLKSHAADPADPKGCVRVMTVMLAEEY